MKIMRNILIIMIVLSGAATIFGQANKVRWTTPTCEFEGTFDTKKYTKAQLGATAKLFEVGYFPQTVDPTPRKFEDVAKLDAAALDREYTAKLNTLKGLNIVKTPYWENLRRRQIKELKQVYELSKATMLAYQTPERLRDVKFAGACLANYGEPLISGGSNLLSAWQIVNEESRRQNSSPERIEALYKEQLNSPDKLKYAQVKVMTFGWWNCVNALIDRQSDYSESEKEYRKLFIRVREIYCDMP